ncbi:hypothetical protein [Prosthecochloris sp.]|uniref:hypothetical protein n=1 Tax=Prosthecochloris sp. TaxID=290513 RepID=UPI0025FA427C|nr:hypothetical protein [Prosthecochloris sp.]
MAEDYTWIVSPRGDVRLTLTWVAEVLVARGWVYKYDEDNQITRNFKDGVIMVEKVIFDDLLVPAATTSQGIEVNIKNLGASGSFGLEVVSDNPITLTYKASGQDDTPGIVDDGSDGKLAEHPGGGKRFFWPSIAPASKIWIYATAGGSAATVSAILNVY